MSRSGLRPSTLAAVLVLWAVAGCKVSVADLDVQGLLDLPADIAVDPGADVVATDLPGRDAPSVDAPAEDVPPVDVPAVDTPIVDAPPEDLPPTDPCGGFLNPNCTAAACDDGDPATENDACRLDTVGTAGCACTGTPVDRCGTGFNPQCQARYCPIGDGTFGVCRIGTVGDACTCTQVDVCAVAKPATTCLPLQCWVKDGTLGICQGADLTLTCGCKAARDPCGDALNPQCWSNLCDLGIEGAGRCRPLNGSCVCSRESADPCNDTDNPKCTPDKCELLNNVKGQCQLGPLGLCGCGPAIVG